jgi:predicted DCC family thiol-disulfide oxidoreductase YuxK
MRALTILYDPGCPLCVRCRHFMEQHPAYVALQFLACTSTQAHDRFGDVPWLGAELVVVSDEGAVWAGPAAFIMCLWVLRDYREWSYRLSGPALAPLAARFFHAVSKRRHRLATWLLGQDSCADGHCIPARAQGAYR